jgi:hypothetical protein
MMAWKARFILHADDDKNVRPAIMPTSAIAPTAIIKIAFTSMAGSFVANEDNPSKICCKTSISFAPNKINY